MFNLQGLVLFALYLAGVVAAMAVAFVLKRTMMRKAPYQPLMLELPEYRWPNLRNLALGLWERVRDFHGARGHHHSLADDRAVVPRRASRRRRPARPGPRSNTALPACLGRGLEFIFAPIGFNWQISIALVPGLPRAKSRSARWARSTRCQRPATTRRRADADDRGDLDPGDRPCRCWPGTSLRRSASRRWRS